MLWGTANMGGERQSLTVPYLKDFVNTIHIHKLPRHAARITFFPWSKYNRQKQKKNWKVDGAQGRDGADDQVLEFIQLEFICITARQHQQWESSLLAAITVTEPEYPTFMCTLGAGRRRRKGNADFITLIRIKHSSQCYLEFFRTDIACED